MAARAVTLALALTLLASCSSDPSGPATQTSAAAAYQNCRPAAAAGFFVDPNSAAVLQVQRWEGQQRADDAAALRKIADRPVATWTSDGVTTVGAYVDAILSCAATQHQVPVLVAYNIPHRDCGNFSSGGAGSPDEYKTWIRNFAAGIRKRQVTVILEPDAVAHAVEGCESEERYALLADAVTVLKSAGPAKVYVDAGNPRWITDVRKLADALQRSGIAKADGFSLNVANFVTTADNIAYGRQISDAIPSKPHFVIDTSRNGAGPLDGPGDVDGGPRWCNPPGRLLGAPPTTTNTGDPRADALLWIKRPGESDGACRPGEPAAGQWWPEYALDLAKRST
ncbi:glycoside hydrolase family 6 protein [Dactylosporangium matsuzakiense]|uniref:glycoside hydrolase family 6 protein n=1 Tax=Dactylosporangium matsuzakiense TaxID=53360 RepID=UPI0021C2E794|nr:glycoside hydrolase family 6 protein [Dactylosporangium matsuzakiense]